MKKLTVLIAAVLLLSLTSGMMMNAAAKVFFKPNYSIQTPSPNMTQILIDQIKGAPPAITDAPVITTAPGNPTKTPEKAAGQLMNNEGPLFLSFRSDLTNKLYMFTPMDLSQDGEYRFPLISNTSQVVGEAKVVVKSGMVIVTYLTVNGVRVDEDNEFLAFFPDIRSVPSVQPKKLGDWKLKFGIPYNIQSWLASDAQVLLYINCAVSYKKNLKGLTSFSLEDPEYIDRMMALLPLMD